MADPIPPAYGPLSPARICSEARVRLNAPSHITYDDHAMNVLYNAAQERWAVDTECLATFVQYPTLAGVPDYSLRRVDNAARSIARVRRVNLRQSPGARRVPLEFCPFDELPYTWRDDSPSMPRCWTMLDAVTLILYPAPSVSVPGTPPETWDSKTSFGLEIDGFGIPEYLQEVVNQSIEDDTNDPHTPFMRDHREGLVRALCLLMAESNYEDPNISARIPLLAANYQQEVDRCKTVNRPVRSYRYGGQARRPIGPAAYDPLTGDRHDARLRW